MLDSTGHERRDGDELFTFGLVYQEGGPGQSVEEVDIFAPESHTARTKLLALIATGEFQAGFDRIVDMPPGGSGGLVVICGG